MRYKFIILFLFISFVSKAQVYQLMPQYGYNTFRMNFDSTIQIPTFCGVPKLGSNVTKKGALAFDSCNNRFYFFNPKLQVWDTIKSADANLFVKYTDTASLVAPYLRKGDTIFLSQRIDQRVKYSDTSLMLLPYLRVVDTTNKWVNSVTKLNDSTIQVIKGTTTSNITISSVSSATRLITQVWNNTGATILRGSVVYISGRHSSNLPTIALAEGNNEANSYKTFALVDGDIADNSSGFVIQAGKIAGLNLPTSSYTDGDILYLSPTVAGGYTTTKPLAPNHIVKLGSVTRAHPTQGSIEIKIENGWQLDELSDVQIAAIPLDSTILQFSRIDSLWHDVNPTTAMGNRFVKSTDSAAMLQPYLRKSDTLSISNRINTKLNISDTANTWVTSVFRKTASDSVFFVRGGANNFAFRDSAGGANIYNSDGTLTGNRTLSVSNNSLTFGGSATASSGFARPYRISPTLTATANNDTLVGLDINPSFTTGAFTNLQNYGLRLRGSSQLFANLSTTGTGLNKVSCLIQDNNITQGGTFGLGYNNSYFYIRKTDGSGNAVDLNCTNSSLTSATPNIRISPINVSIQSSGRTSGSSAGNQMLSVETNTNTLDYDGIILTQSTMGSGTQNQAINWFANGGYYAQIAAQVGSGYTDNRLIFRVGNSSRVMTEAMRLTSNQNMLLGTITDVASSLLTLESTTKGFLRPRMTTSQMNAISTPATGLSVFNTTDSLEYVYRGTSSGWQKNVTYTRTNDIGLLNGADQRLMIEPTTNITAGRALTVEAGSTQAGGTSAFQALSQTSRRWTGMAAAPNGDIYASVQSGDIYRRVGGIGNFVALSQTSRIWQAMAAASNGDIYAVVYGGDIYKQTGGTGNFVGLGQTSRNWTGISVASNGDIYATVFGGDIYKSVGGGTFTALGQTSRNWYGVTVASNGDVYACVFNGDIWRSTNGGTTFSALSQTSRQWYGLASSSSGDIYAVVNGGDIYKQTGGTGNFIGLSQTSRAWSGITLNSNGDIYASVDNGDIYLQSQGTANLNGGTLVLQSGIGKGTGTSTINFNTGTTLSSGSTLQTASTKMTILGNGNVGIGTTSPSAKLELSDTARGFLQTRMTTTQRNNIASPSVGLQVFTTTDSSQYVYRGTGAGWQQIANEIVNTASLNFPSTNAQNSSDLTITLTGAVDGDAVVLGVPNAAVNANSCYTAWVSAANTVTVRFNNYSSGAIDPASATFRVTIIK